MPKAQVGSAPRRTHVPEELAKIRGDIARALAKVGG